MPRNQERIRNNNNLSDFLVQLPCSGDDKPSHLENMWEYCHKIVKIRTIPSRRVQVLMVIQYHL